MITRSKKLFWFSYWLAVVLLGICALLVAILRVTYPNLPQYQDTLEAKLSEVLQADVSIGEIEAYWKGQNPILKLRDLSVEGATSVRVERATLALNLPRSITYRQPVFDQLELVRPVIKINSGADSKSSPELHFDEAAGARVLAALLRQQHISIQQANVQFRQQGLPPLEVDGLDISLNTEKSSHQLLIDAAFVQDGTRVPLSLAAEVKGNPKRKPVSFYLELPALSEKLLQPWSQALGGPSIDALKADLRFWGEFRRNELRYLQSRIAVDALMVDQQRFTDAKLNASLIHHDMGYQAQFDGNFSANDKAYKLPLVVADWRAILQGIPDKVSLDRVDLSQLTGWLDGQPFLPDMGQRALSKMKPQGVINNLTMRWTSTEAKAFVLEADLEKVAVGAWGGAPGLRGITGRLQHTIDGGSIDLESDNFRMSFPDLKMPEWQYPFARGRVLWSLKDSAVKVTSGHLQLQNNAVTANGRFFFRMPFDKDGQTDLSLLIGVTDSEGVAFKDYIPPREVGEQTHSWLMSALQGGTVRSGGFMLNANTRARLADYQKPVVQLFLDVDKLTFGFDREWPSITRGDGYFLYRDHGFLVEAKGAILDSDITEGWVYKAPKADQLTVLGNALGDAQDIRRILMETPVREALGEEIADWEWAANANTYVQVDVDLDKRQAPQIDASSQLSEGRLVSVKHRLSFEKLAGTLRFNSATGLQSDALKGTLFGHQVTAAINTSRDEEQGVITRVSLMGEAEMTQLKNWLDLPLLAIADGTTAYEANLQICATNPACTQLSILSALNGVRVRAPVPLAKNAGAYKQFKLKILLGSPTNQPMFLQYGDQFSGAFELQNDQVTRAHLLFGEGDPRLPKEEGLWINGTLDALELSELISFLKDAGFLGGETQSGKGPTLEDVYLRIGEFRTGSIILNDLETRVQELPKDWLISANNEQINGTLTLPKDESAVARMELNHLTLQHQSDDSVDQSVAAKPEPSDLPSLDLSIKRLTVNDKPMGAWKLQVRPYEEGARFNEIQASLPGVEVAGSAEWFANGTERSSTTLSFKGNNISDLLESWGYGRLVESEFIGSDVNFSWLGAPWDFGLERLNGRFNLRAKNGRIIQAGSSGQFLRVLGILNLETVARRLKLDFSDLFQEGLAFDRIDADYRLHDGIAHSNTPFKLKGPSADMELSGQIDLVKETVDKDMQVVLPVTKNLPIVGILLGQPQVAGAVYLIDKLIGNRLEQFTTISYHLTGDWSDPQLDLSQAAEESPDNGIQDEYQAPGLDK